MQTIAYSLLQIPLTPRTRDSIINQLRPVFPNFLLYRPLELDISLSSSEHEDKDESLVGDENADKSTEKW